MSKNLPEKAVSNNLSEKAVSDKALEEALQNEPFEKEFNEESFWNKIKTSAEKAGCVAIRDALRLYYVLKKPELPMKVKVVIIAALGYFISPFDIIPDLIPFVGFTDDLAILATTVAYASMYIDSEVKESADEKLADWFGEGACQEDENNKGVDDKKDDNHEKMAI